MSSGGIWSLEPFFLFIYLKHYLLLTRTLTLAHPNLQEPNFLKSSFCDLAAKTHFCPFCCILSSTVYTTPFLFMSLTFFISLALPLPLIFFFFTLPLRHVQPKHTLLRPSIFPCSCSLGSLFEPFLSAWGWRGKCPFPSSRQVISSPLPPHVLSLEV